MPELIVFSGLPGSGKSTFAKELKGYKVHSSDDLRKELFGDMNRQDKNSELFDELHKRIITDLKSDNDVVFDATNISYKTRMSLLDKVKKIDCKKTSYLFATPYEQCVAQNNNRDRKVGIDVIKGMYKNFFIPQYYEKWNEIKIIWNFNTDEFDINEKLKIFHQIDHGNPHHRYSIGEHMSKCAKELKELIDDNIDYKNLYLASQVHDCGKPFTKEYNSDKGYFTYYQHHLVGAYDCLFYFKVLGYNDADILEICNYVQWHMQPFFLETEKSIEKFKNLVGEKVYNDLLLLHEADIRAKGV